jgi:hypothetical protein
MSGFATLEGQQRVVPGRWAGVFARREDCLSLATAQYQSTIDAECE